jgi:hypothetical protein
MQDVIDNAGFLQIGKTQLLVWGWAKGRDGKAKSVPLGIDIAKKAINAKEHYKYVVGKDYDIHCGILTNFSFKVNADLTVDVTLELSQPSDIPAFLALENKASATRVEKTEDETSKGTAIAAQAAKLDPEDTDSSAYKTLLGYSINIQTEVFDNTFGNTDTPYIQLGYIVKTICNNGEVKSMGEIPVDVRIDDAVISGKQRMISCSENIIIPCPALPETDTNGEYKILFTDNLNLDDNSDVYKENGSTFTYNPGLNRLSLSRILADNLTGSLQGTASYALAAATSSLSSLDIYLIINLFFYA